MKTVPIGRALVRAGLVTADQLRDGLNAQRREGGLLGRHLILSGAVTRRDMYGVLAKQWGAPLVDLVEDPPDNGLITGSCREMLDRGWIPWRREGDVVVVATSVPPTVALLESMRTVTGASTVVLLTTTDWDVAQAVSGARRAEIVPEVEEREPGEPFARSSRSDLALRRLRVPLVVAFVFTATFFWQPQWAFNALLLGANAVFLFCIGFIVVASFRTSPRKRPQGQNDRSPIRDVDLPIYTILVPTKHVEGSIEKHLSNLETLDYPKAKLEVLVLVDEDDAKTLAVLKGIRPPEFVRILSVPRGVPRTKPRSCNYGLSFARGEYVVVFDPDDRPESAQLRRAVGVFRDDKQERLLGDPRQRPLICLQGTLSYGNANRNVLTRLAAVEYAMWFDTLLPAIDDWGIPLPLGGTSNHFVTEGLRTLGAWDPRHATEDADLGLRVANEGMRVAAIESNTEEEACVAVEDWVTERTRWVKGNMLTVAAGVRHPVRYVRRTGPISVFALGGLMMGSPLAFFAFPLAVGIAIVTFAGLQWSGLDLPGWLLIVGMVWLLAGNLAMIILSGLAATRRYTWRVGIYALLSPAYWCLQSYAACRAVFRLLTRPDLRELSSVDPGE